MPGLYGVVAKNPSVRAGDVHAIGARMSAAIRQVPWLQVDCFANDWFCGGRVHLGAGDAAAQPARSADERVLAWLDGFCRSTVGESLGTPSADTIGRLLAGNGAGLNALDGTFSLAVLEDGRELTIATDRLGFRPLYYTETEHWFAYAAEVKALLAARDGLPPIDEIAVRQFFAFDHLLGDRTWWRGIEVVPPASVWRISNGHRTTNRYWSFADIRPEPVDRAAAYEAFGQLWARDVAQLRAPRRMPVLLSGGQDSRLLLAELVAQGADVVAVTYGSPASPEVGPARMAAAAANVEHRICEWNPHNWWYGREEGIWQTDGLVNANHLHPVIARNELRGAGGYTLLNIVGDLLFGGSHLDQASWGPWRDRPESLLERRYVDNPFFSRDEALAASVDDARMYAEGPSSDCFHLRQRVRRYVLHSPGCYGSFCESAFPGVSHDLLQLFLGGLTDKDRVKHKFYNPFLVERHPKYFADIPWQPTGRGLAESLPVKVARGLRWRMERVAGIARGYPPSNQWFVDYPACVRQHRIAERLLDADLLSDTVLNGRVREALEKDAARPLAAESVIAILTFETYLRQVEGLASVLVDKRGGGGVRTAIEPARDASGVTSTDSNAAIARQGAALRVASSTVAAGGQAAPLVTVVIPAYNRGSRLVRAIESLQQQTLSHWEAIVVDDGSQDDTPAVVSRLSAEDARIRLLRLDRNRGAQSARNAGIRAARAPWIAFLDSDDWYVPESLELRLARADHEGVQVVHSECYVLHGDDALKHYGVTPLAGRIYRILLQREGPVFPALLVRAEALRRIGLLDERIRAFQEWDTSIRLARHYPFAFVATPTFVYDCRGRDAMSKDRRRGGEGYEQIVRKHLLAMGWHGGPAVLARHFRIAAEWYESGGDFAAGQRCRRFARAAAAGHPPTLLQYLRRVATPGYGRLS